MKIKRCSTIYICLTLLVILLGLCVRKVAFLLPDAINLYAGDMLWAGMIFLGFGVLFPRLQTGQLIIVSLAFCYFIEVSQLYHAPWMDHIRATTIGGLVLGYGFLWSDILAYTVGISISGLLEKSSQRN